MRVLASVEPRALMGCLECDGLGVVVLATRSGGVVDPPEELTEGCGRCRGSGVDPLGCWSCGSEGDLPGLCDTCMDDLLGEGEVASGVA